MKRYRFRGYPMEILCALHRSVLNWDISCDFDEGYAVKLGDPVNGYKVEAQGFKTLIEAVEWLSEEAIKHYPNSDFAQ